MPVKADISPEQFDVLHAHYLKHPDEFTVDVLGANPWEKQVQIIESTFENKITAVKTCNAVGKSYIAARIVVTYLMLYPDSIVVTTAPTWSQVTDVLWREIATTVKQAEMKGFKLTDKEVNQAGLSLGTNWYAVGRSTKRPENFFGYHADHILVVVDEAGGVDEPIFKGVAAITPNANARILLIGNPTIPGGTFYNYFNKPELGANCFTISAFDTPNFTANNINTVEDLLEIYTPPEGVSQIQHNKELMQILKMPYPALMSPEVAYGRYFEWGPDSPSWQALIMGEFPTEAEQQLIPTNLVIMAQNMRGKDSETGESMAEMSGWEIPEGYWEYGQDMARYGNDNSVLFPRHGGWVEDPIAWGKSSLMDSADKILKIIDPLDPNVRVNIDDSGNGGGTTDRLRQISNQEHQAGRSGHRYSLVAYNFSSKEMMSDADRDKYHDVTSMLYFNLRKWFIGHKISIPKNQRLFDELVARRYFMNKQGKLQVESKDDYKKRTGGKSPDYSDALALAFAGRVREIQSPPTLDQERARLNKKVAQRPITSGLSGSF